MKKEDAHSAPRRPPSIPSQWCVCRDVPRLGEMGVVHPRCTQEGKGAFPLKTWPTACVCSGIVSFNSRRGRKPDEILLEQLQQRLVSWSFRAMHQRFPTRHFWVLTNYMLKLLPRSTFFKEKTPTSSPPPPSRINHLHCALFQSPWQLNGEAEDRPFPRSRASVLLNSVSDNSWLWIQPDSQGTCTLSLALSWGAQEAGFQHSLNTINFSSDAACLSLFLMFP